MDLATLESLQTPAGRAALAEAVALSPDDATFLRCFTRLSKRYEASLARGALAMAMLRRKAATKFSRAAEMFFEREALEQASGEAVATHRALRFSGVGRVMDLCCGLGGDAVALAEVSEVTAVDLDPLRLRLCELNLTAYGRRARLILGDALAVDLAGAGAVFVDPDRRPEGRRQLSLSACRPALAEVLARVGSLPMCAKVAPGVSWAELTHLDAEAEFVSLGGELKECSLWLGAWRTSRRRATLLPSGATLCAEVPAPSPGCATPRGYLYDPDPAVVRSGLVTDLAQRLGAKQLDIEIAYLSADELVPTPFAKAYRIEESLPFHLARLRELLRGRGIGRVTVTRRGSAIDPAELVRKLRLKGDETRTLVLTRVEGRPWVLVCQPVPQD